MQFNVQLKTEKTKQQRQASCSQTFFFIIQNSAPSGHQLLWEAAAPCLSHSYISLLWNSWKEIKSNQASEKQSFPLWYEFLKTMLKPSCSRKRAMNCEEICVEEEKGELTAKLGQLIDSRGQNLANSLLGNLLLQGRLQFCLKILMRKEGLQAWLLGFAEFLQLQENKKEVNTF